MSKIEQIKQYRKQYGLTLKDAYEMVMEKRNKMSLVQLSAIGRQTKINSIWHKHCWPWEGCIVKANYGQHIKIVCLNCGAIGTTKNIDFVGARTLFINCVCDSDESIRPVLEPVNNEENLTNNVI